MSSFSSISDLFGDFLHALKGIESVSINLRDPFCSAISIGFPSHSGLRKLAIHVREIFVMRQLINAAVAGFLHGSSDGLILCLATSIHRWLIVIDSSLDHIITSSRKVYQVASWLQMTVLQQSLIKTLFFIIANDRMIQAYERGTLKEFDELATALYHSSDYWLRFPNGFDLIGHLGELFRSCYEANYHLFRDSRLELFPSSTQSSSRITVEYSRVIMMHSIFHQVSGSVFLNGQKSTLSHLNKWQPLDNADEENLRAIDLQKLWSGLLLSPNNNNQELQGMLQCLEAAVPLQTATNTGALRDLGKLTSLADNADTMSNPLDFFKPDITYAAENFNLILKESSLKLKKKEAKLSLKVAELTQAVTSTVTVKLQDLPATLPMPRSLKSKNEILLDDENVLEREEVGRKAIEVAVQASSKDRAPPTISAEDDTQNEIDNRSSTILGVTKTVDPVLMEEAKQILQAKYAKLQLEMDRRKAKAVWQIRRLKRLKSARKLLSEMYEDPRSMYYRHIVTQSPNKSTAYESVFSPSVQEHSQPGEEALISLSSNKKKKSRTEKRMKVGSNETQLSKLLFSDATEEVATKRDLSAPNRKSNNVREQEAVADKQRGSLETKATTNSNSSLVEKDAITTSENLEEQASSKLKDAKIEADTRQLFEDEYLPIAPYNPAIELQSTLPEDNLVPKPTKRENPTVFIDKLRSSLQLLGLEEALTAEQFLQNLCASLSVSLLLTGLSTQLLDVASTNSTQQVDALRQYLASTTANQSLSIEKIILQVLSTRIVPRYQGFVSYFQAMSLAVHSVEVENFRISNVYSAKRLILRHDLVRHLLAMQELFLMSPNRCSSFLFDTCVHLVDQAWQRLNRHSGISRNRGKNNEYLSRRTRLPAHQQEDLWSNVALTEALRDASSRLHPDWQTYFRSARYFFQQKQSDGTNDRYFQALIDAHEYWPLVANHRLHSLVIDFQVNPALQIFFNKETMRKLSSFTRRYLEIGQLMGVYRIISIEMRRSEILRVNRHGLPRLLHLQLFDMLHTLQAFLRYFNDRHMTLTRRYYQAMQDNATEGLHRLIQFMICYADEIHLASFCTTEAERNLITSDFTDFSLNSVVLLRICLDHILQEVRLFAMYILSYLTSETTHDMTRNEGSTGHNSEEKRRAKEMTMENMLMCGKKIRDYRMHVAHLCDGIVEPELKDHVRCLRYYVSGSE